MSGARKTRVRHRFSHRFLKKTRVRHRFSWNGYDAAMLRVLASIACVVLVMAVFLLAMGRLYSPLPSDTAFYVDARTKSVTAPEPLVMVDRDAECDMLLEEMRGRSTGFRACRVAADCERVTSVLALPFVINKKYSPLMRRMIDELEDYCPARWQGRAFAWYGFEVVCRNRRCGVSEITPREKHDLLVEETNELLSDAGR